MPTLQTILTTPRANGLYRLPATCAAHDLAARVAAANTVLITIDGDAVEGKAEFLRAIATALDFPPYFGRNWDALADCLTDLSWLPDVGKIVVFDHPAPLIRRSPATWATAAAIFAEAADYWAGKGQLFSIVLRNTEGMVPTLTILDR
jgi:RNAse (barnase) inhibitor barstar